MYTIQKVIEGRLPDNDSLCIQDQENTNYIIFLYVCVCVGGWFVRLCVGEGVVWCVEGEEWLYVCILVHIYKKKIPTV